MATALTSKVNPAGCAWKPVNERKDVACRRYNSKKPGWYCAQQRPLLALRRLLHQWQTGDLRPEPPDADASPEQQVNQHNDRQGQQDRGFVQQAPGGFQQPQPQPVLQEARGVREGVRGPSGHARAMLQEQQLPQQTAQASQQSAQGPQQAAQAPQLTSVQHLPSAAGLQSVASSPQVNPQLQTPTTQLSQSIGAQSNGASGQDTHVLQPSAVAQASPVAGIGTAPAAGQAPSPLPTQQGGEATVASSLPTSTSQVSIPLSTQEGGQATVASNFPTPTSAANVGAGRQPAQQAEANAAAAVTQPAAAASSQQNGRFIAAAGSEGGSAMPATVNANPNPSADAGARDAGLKPLPNFVLVIDDDTNVNPVKFLDFLKTLNPNDTVYQGARYRKYDFIHGGGGTLFSRQTLAGFLRPADKQILKYNPTLQAYEPLPEATRLQWTLLDECIHRCGLQQQRTSIPVHPTKQC